jgi:hypothetical protein
MDVEHVLDLYYEAAAEGMGIVPFVTRLIAGAYGPIDKVVLVRFLDRLEVIIAGNIETKLEEMPGGDAAAEEAGAALREELTRARTLLADA